MTKAGLGRLRFDPLGIRGSLGVENRVNACNGLPLHAFTGVLEVPASLTLPLHAHRIRLKKEASCETSFSGFSGFLGFFLR